MRFHTALPLLLLAGSTHASSFYEQPFPDTVRAASQIVRGKVGKTETQWTTLPDGSKHLFTYYEVEVSEGIKGKPKAGSPVRIRELGGEKDGVSLQVSGTAHFSAGEDIVVMLGEGSEAGDHAFPVMGMMMGKFNVERGADGKEYLRGPGIGSSLHPALRNENTPSGKLAQVSLESLREIVKTQSAEPTDVKPSNSPVKVAGEPLLSSKANGGITEIRPVKDENLTPALSDKKKDAGFKPILLVIGAILGSLWYWNSKKRRK